MKIAIDVSRAVNEKAGVGRVAFCLVKALLNLDKENQYFLFCSYFRKDKEKREVLKLFEGPNVSIKVVKMPGKLREKLNQTRLPLIKKYFKDADVYLAPTFLDVIFSLDIPQILIVHDMTNFKYPEHAGEKISRQYQKLTLKACQKAVKIIAVSQSTKDDIVDILKVDPRKIEVVYPGKKDFPQISSKLPENLQPKKYILSVGTIEPRKNLVEFFRAYSLLDEETQNDYPLVIVGAKGWNTGETFQVLKEKKLENKVKFLGYVTDEELAKLYQEAAIFVYPSLYEGFGLPVLEALSFGAPVITSNISSLPEVAGHAAILIDPKNPTMIAKAMKDLLGDFSKRTQLSKLSREQSQKFSWEKSARDVLKIFENVIE